MFNNNLAVALIFFNRPETLTKVFERVKEVKPSKLFLIQDGAREGNENDVIKINKCREIVGEINWNCEIFRNYSEINLGCGLRPSSGISWVFQHVESAIILEDDCIPDLSFFRFCHEMLERYKDDERVMMVSGTNHLGEYSVNNYSYLYSKATAIWGWATWKRSWDKYDYFIQHWNNDEIKRLLKSGIIPRYEFKIKRRAWNQTFKKLSSNERISWWDYQWNFCVYINSGLGIVPKQNLISNIGFGLDSTHFKNQKEKHRLEAMRTKPIQFPLIHPPFVMCDHTYDNLVFKIISPPVSILVRIALKIFRVLFKKSN